MTAPDASAATGTHSSAEDAPSAAERVIAEDIEQTRAELGRTVQQLAAKADVKSRAQDAAVQLGHRASHQAAALQGRATRRAQRLAGQLAQAGDAVPDHVSDTAQVVAGKARRYWMPLTSAAVALVVAALAARKLRR
jgi:hypothetical protein